MFRWSAGPTLLLLGLAGCSSAAPNVENAALEVSAPQASRTTAPSADGASAAPSTGLFVAPFTLIVAGDHGFTAAVDAHGNVRFTSGDRQIRLRFDGDRVVTEGGEWIARRDEEGGVHERSIIHTMTKGKVTGVSDQVVLNGTFEGDRLVNAANHVWSIRDDGELQILSANEPTRSTNARFEGLDPRAREAALVLYIGLVFGGVWGPVLRESDPEDAPP